MAAGRDLRVAGRLHLRQEPALLRGHDHDADAGRRHRGRPRAGHAGRQRHHRPHLARRLHRAGHARRPLPDRARRAARRLQLLRGPAGQPRGDDARHLRQRPAAQPCWLRAPRAAYTLHLPDGDRDLDLTTPPCSTPTRACRWSSSPGGSTAPAPAGTGRPRAPRCSGVRAVIAESFERIHRSNLIGMGVLPLQFYKGDSAEGLALTRRRSASPSRGSTSSNGGELPKELTVIGHGGRRLDHRVPGDRPHRHPHGGRVLPARRDSALRAAPAGQLVKPPPSSAFVHEGGRGRQGIRVTRNSSAVAPSGSPASSPRRERPRSPVVRRHRGRQSGSCGRAMRPFCARWSMSSRPPRWDRFHP